MLTKGLDNVPGTSGNDTIIGSVDDNNAELNTMSTLDVVNGGAGVDTLKIAFNNTKGTGLALPNLSNVEVIEVQATQAFKLDTSTTAGVTDLNVTKASGAAILIASDAQNISVAGATNTVTIDGGKNITVNDATADQAITIGATTVNAGTITVTDTKLGTAALAIDGGTDVTVTASGITTGTIDIGQGGAATDLASGAVVVNATGAAFVAAADATLGNITIDGGTTISVTQVATSDASKAAADKTGGTVTQGNVTIVAAATTTAVTVKQDAARGETLAADSTGGATETVSVKFVDIKANDNVTLGDGTNALNFTASEDMTAAQVAAAFANLSLGAALPSDATPTKAVGDTQGSGKHTLGTYDGDLGSWSSGAANGDTVVFTFKTTNTAPAGLALVDTGTTIAAGTITLTQATTGKAHDATPVGGVMGIVAGDVDITGGAALATVTVDGYGNTVASQIQGTTNNALATVNLSNGADFDIASAAATLALNLTNVTGTVDVIAGTTTLNATVTTNSATAATLASATATAVNVSGTGRVAGTTATGITAATAINTTGMTAGSAAFALTSTATSYTGGAGADEVTLINITATDKAIDLGAGNDTLVLAAGGATTSTVTLKGGAGDDTLSLTTALAANDSLSGSGTFAAKLDSFERLLINNAGATKTVDLANLGFTNYVTAAGSGGTLTLDKLATNGTVILTANATTGVTVNVKDAATTLTDVLNVTLSKDGVLAAGKLTAADVETINLTVTDPGTTAIATHTLTLAADKATSLSIGGNAGLTLTLDAATVKLATIDAGGMTGGALTATANGSVAMTITGGAGNDVLAASIGATAKADVINGGAGNDTITAGANGATLNGGAGNDLFILGNAAGTAGTKAANTYSTIADFQAGDVLQLLAYNTGGTADLTAVTFTKLAANVQDAVNPQSYMEAVMDELATAGTLGTAVWFMHGSDTYIVVDSGAAAAAGDVFAPSDDLIIKLTGVNGANLSFNSDFGTVAL